AVFATRGYIYPPLIGGDIGCGMSLTELKTLKSSKLDQDKISNKLRGIEGKNIAKLLLKKIKKKGPYESELLKNYMEEHPSIVSSNFNDNLGTIGGGNHFCEIVTVEKIVDEGIFLEKSLNEESVFLLTHSGSRGLGQSILDEFSKSVSLKVGSEECNRYLEKHDEAVEWGIKNRELIGRRVLECLNICKEDTSLILDVCHNAVVSKTFKDLNERYLHRKGAAPGDKGLIVIPGSRGAFSYLVLPYGDQEENCFSLAHGAGRKWSRNQVATKLRQKYGKSSKAHSVRNYLALTRTRFGNSVICEDKDLLLEEAPMAYKEIEDVIEDLSEFVKVVAILKPFITYKTRK
ncbi:hypothetical protein HK099_001526, partial [Clydaea vesicula]